MKRKDDEKDPNKVTEMNQLLFNDNIYNKVAEMLRVCTPVWELLVGSKTEKMIWSIEKILKLNSPKPDLNDTYQIFKNEALNVVGLTAFFLDHTTDKTLLNTRHLGEINMFVLLGYKKPIHSQFGIYRNKHPPFNQPQLDELSSSEFWHLLDSGEVKELAAAAKQLLNLPSSAYFKDFYLPEKFGKLSLEDAEKVLLLKVYGNE